MSTVICVQWCRKVVKSGGGGGNIMDYVLLAVLYTSRRVWRHALPESVLVFLCSETAFGGKYLLTVVSYIDIDEPNYHVQKCVCVWGGGGGGAVAPAPCPPLPHHCCGTLLHCIMQMEGSSCISLFMIITNHFLFTVT